MADEQEDQVGILVCAMCVAPVRTYVQSPPCDICMQRIIIFFVAQMVGILREVGVGVEVVDKFVEEKVTNLGQVDTRFAL